jgi:beta-barrel assembly-enhancing protease
MRSTLFTLAFSCFVILSSAQSLLPVGPIPEFYSCPSHERVDKQIHDRRAAGDTVSTEEEEFMRQMTYYSQQRVLSGFVLFNDSLSTYVSRVGAEVLRNDPKTLSELNFYVYKSPTPNAYTSATGTILVTVGLLAQLENEAQLAYILCHEITHYRQRHMLKGYLNREELNNSKTSTASSIRSSYISYNQEQELEADRLGFELFMQSGYNKKEVLRSFDVLEYSEFPFDDLPYDTLFLNQDYIKIPVGYYMKEVDPIYSDDNHDDRRSTHPNVRKRRMAMMTLLDTVQHPEGKLFIVSKEEFLAGRESSRYEVCRLYLEYRAYPEAIYCSYMMLQRHPDDLFLKKIIGRSLYNLAAYRQVTNSPGLFDFGFFLGYGTYGGRYSALTRSGYYRVPDFKEYPGQQQQLFHLFREIEADELTVLALAYNWKLHKAQPGDSLQAILCDSLFSMIVNNQNLHLSYFSTITPDSARAQLKMDSLARAAETGETGDSKFSRIDKFKLSSEKERFTKFAFVELLKDSEFVAKFKYYTDHRQSLVANSELVEYHTSKEQKAIDSEKENFGYGINRVIIMSPDYSYYQQKKRNEEPDQDYAKSENGQLVLTNLIRTQATAAGVQAVVLDPYSMDSLARDSFADYAALNEWFFEKMQHGANGYAWTINNQQEADSISKKYGTRYVMFSSVEIGHYKKIQHPVLFGISCLAVVPAIRAFIPRHTYYYDVAILDLKTGQVIEVRHEKIKRGKEKDASEKFFGNVFEKMKKPVKK